MVPNADSLAVRLKCANCQHELKSALHSNVEIKSRISDTKRNEICLLMTYLKWTLQK